MIAARRRAAVIRGLRPCAGLEVGLNPGQIRRVVARRRPDGAGAGDGEGRVEREAGLDGGTRLVQPTKLGKSGGQLEMRIRIVSVGLDRPSTPRDGLLPTAEVVLRKAREFIQV